MINWQNGITPINETNMNKLVQEDMITDAYSTSSTYAVGDYCIYGNTLYKCTTAIATAEAWNSGHWTAVTVAEELDSIADEVDNKLNKTIKVTNSTANLNDYTEDGTYFFDQNVTITNAPSGVNGWLEVKVGEDTSTNETRIKQIWYRAGTNGNNDYETYIRTYQNGSWGNWNQLQIKLNDTGWVDMSISGSAVTARDQGRYKPQVRKIGNLVQIKGQIMASSNLNDNTSLSMPTEFIPNDMELSYVTNNASIWVALTGELHITSTSSSYININTCYMLS